MPRLKTLLRRALFPPLPVVWGCALGTTALMVAHFAFGFLREHPAACLLYSFFAYSLAVVCLRLQRWGRQRLMPAVRGHALVQRWRTATVLRAQVTLFLSLGVNLLYAGVKLFSGIYYRSPWFISLGVYYVCLLCMRLLLAYCVRRWPVGTNLRMEYRCCRACGAIMVLMNLALAGVIVLVLEQNRTFHYAGVLIYAMALYTFCALPSACINFFRLRHQGSPVLSTTKVISLAAALMSMLSLEIAMLSQFGTAENPSIRRFFIAITGGVVCAMILAMAVGLIVLASRRLKEMEAGA